MPQVLNVTMPVQIPDDYKLIEKSEYDDLKANEVQGKLWTKEDLRDLLGGRSFDWIKERVLYNPRLSKDYEEMKRNKFIIEAKGKGGRWLFKASEMKNFIDRNWNLINWEA
ncbi:DUF771 domain-containing protein [Lentilactobacillus senioris]|uniref:DUF771 domain-containing protein n=1 Tax=Lentilactobacillus senioris TaxID=931534 RepID=UPI00227F309D|nr:DUF771 domain-containing protein [Lentilactobacillus senioris]MCY9807075.1 DUF771 domain-containing protein [Lentilactobacillus senioris]